MPNGLQDVMPVAAAFVVLYLAVRLYVRKIVVTEGSTVLVYRNGRFARELKPGRYFRRRLGTRCKTFDLRRKTMTIPGQDVLSKDNVGLKVSLVVSYEIADARRAAEKVQCFTSELHVAAQLALRTVLAQSTIDEILAARTQLAKQLLPIVAAQAAAFGLKVHAVEIKDAMFPGELKHIFAQVVRAREEGRAALEKARGETAALRNLANAARLLEGNPALMNLRVLQTIAAAGNGGGSTVVLGVPPGLTALTHGKPAGTQGQDES